MAKPEKPRSARILADLWEHPSTEWMSSIHRDILFMACVNILGILEIPVGRIASRCKAPVGEVEAALEAMETHNNAVWWPTECVLWVINAPEYNCMNPSMWMAAHKTWKVQPRTVRDRIVESWPNIATGTEPDRGMVSPQDDPHGVPPPSPPRMTPMVGGQDSDSDGDSESASSSSAHSRVTALREKWAQTLAALKVELGPCTDPTRDPQAYAGLCEALEQHGEALVLQVTEWAVRQAPTGALTATMFRGAGFGAQLDRYLASRKVEIGRKMVAPHKLSGRILTNDEQRAWVVTASGGADPEAALRGAWALEEARKAQAAEELAKELGL